MRQNKMNAQQAVGGQQASITEVLALTTNQLTDMAAACCTLLDVFESTETFDGFVRGWLIGLKALDALIEDELDVRMSGNDEMENGA